MNDVQIEELQRLIAGADACYKRAIEIIKRRPATVEIADEALVEFENTLLLSEDIAMLMPTKATVETLSTIRSQIAELKRLRSKL